MENFEERVALVSRLVDIMVVCITYNVLHMYMYTYMYVYVHVCVQVKCTCSCLWTNMNIHEDTLQVCCMHIQV